MCLRGSIKGDHVLEGEDIHLIGMLAHRADQGPEVRPRPKLLDRLQAVELHKAHEPARRAEVSQQPRWGYDAAQWRLGLLACRPRREELFLMPRL
jgi:hypothetical protein